jgi:hypothetical protein
MYNLWAFYSGTIAIKRPNQAASVKDTLEKDSSPPHYSTLKRVPRKWINMWLINTHTMKLEEFMGVTPPTYAILSHTWEDEEVPFERCPAAYQLLSNRRKDILRLSRHVA